MRISCFPCSLIFLFTYFCVFTFTRTSNNTLNEVCIITITEICMKIIRTKGDLLYIIQCSNLVVRISLFKFLCNVWTWYNWSRESFCLESVNYVAINGDANWNSKSHYFLWPIKKQELHAAPQHTMGKTSLKGDRFYILYVCAIDIHTKGEIGQLI